MKWEEPIILFALLVGKKGWRKSPILKLICDPLRELVYQNQNDGADYVFLDGLEGMTSQLMINDGEMLQIANEAQSILMKLYSSKGLHIKSNLKFKFLTKIRGATIVDHVALNFIGCLHPESCWLILQIWVYQPELNYWIQFLLSFYYQFS